MCPPYLLKRLLKLLTTTETYAILFFKPSSFTIQTDLPLRCRNTQGRGPERTCLSGRLHSSTHQPGKPASSGRLLPYLGRGTLCDARDGHAGSHTMRRSGASSLLLSRRPRPGGNEAPRPVAQAGERRRRMPLYRITNRITKETCQVEAPFAQDACERLGWVIGDCYVRLLKESPFTDLAAQPRCVEASHEPFQDRR